jgi:hypothetical protein
MKWTAKIVFCLSLALLCVSRAQIDDVVEHKKEQEAAKEAECRLKCSGTTAAAGIADQLAEAVGGALGTACVPTTAYDISTVGLTDFERQAVNEYVKRTNVWLECMGPARVQPTKGTLYSQAKTAARKERIRAAAAGHAYKGQAGHVPDTGLTGLAEPPCGWIDLPGNTNQKIGGALSSKIGKFVVALTVDGVCP